MIVATSTFLEVIFAALILTPIILLWIAALVDVVQSHRGGLNIAAMLILILIVPILGPILYFIFRKPTEYSAEAVAAAHADLERERGSRPVGTGLYR